MVSSIIGKIIRERETNQIKTGMNPKPVYLIANISVSKYRNGEQKKNITVLGLYCNVNPNKHNF